MEAGLELTTIVGLDGLDLEGQPVENQVNELDGSLLVEPLIDPEHAKPSAVVDRGVLVEPLAVAGEG